MTITEFLARLAVIKGTLDRANEHALERAAKMVRDEAKSAIGTYRYDWPHLSPETLKKKEGDTPLLETGELQQSIEASADDKRARVGSNLDKAVIHELGTSKIPPRSFLAEAASHKAREIVHEIGRVISLHLAGKALPED